MRWSGDVGSMRLLTLPNHTKIGRENRSSVDGMDARMGDSTVCPHCDVSDGKDVRMRSGALMLIDRNEAVSIA